MPDTLSADVVVIGSGICGALAARKLAQAGASVLMLEAGPRVSRAQLVHNFRRSARKSDLVAAYPYSPLAPHPDYQPADNGYLVQAGPYPYKPEYLRVVGGTSWHWAAQAWRLMPNDFRLASLYGVGRDWPIGYDDLEPHYFEAETIMGVSGPIDNGSPRTRPFPMDPVEPSWLEQRFRDRLAPEFHMITNTTARNSRSYDGRPACCGNNNCMPICPIDAQYHGGLAAESAERSGVRLIPQAVVYQLEHDAAGRIVAARYYDWDKVSHRVTAKSFVLAANAIETPKLLFLSASGKYPDGLANRSGTLGRHLMDHPSSAITFEVDEPLWPGRGPVSPCSIQQFRDGDFRADHAGFRVDLSNGSRVASIAADLIKAGVSGTDLDARIRHRAAREVSIKNVLEQLPDPDNRVTLSDRKDALGLPTPRLSYSFDDYVHRGMAAAKQVYTRIAERMGGTNIRFSPDGQYSNNQHITGTLSMGHDPATSVTDAVGRAHDHANLWMVGTGVMPTVATCNSTLTAVALALRSVDAMLKSA
ncbi:GMC family oxidoreductase [Sphingomonas abietis]|uniref:GMC family oxidoreductase n=1 Tax=Sphingomonas abietis TaxID=3012344 RepID=A0ABY7NN56_9SPHN|nr:GMC family oxidoreductase [Sphingomonas abietis]WBO21344.1 GMC family oxidoreductase [Sphingomonas abietis]